MRENLTRVMRVGGVLAGVIALAASASAPAKHTVLTTTSLTSDFDASWSAVIDVFSERGWPIQTSDKASGIIATDWMRMNEDDAKRYADCGGSGIASVDGAQVRFNVRVKEEDGGSSVAVNVAFREMRHFENDHGMVDCTSRGTLEADMHGWVDDRSKGARKKKPKPVEPTPAALRGFYCTSNATTGTCSREKATCETVRGAMLAAASDLGACTLTESAFCFDAGSGNQTERCAPTNAICDGQRAAVASAGACAEAK